MVNSTNCVLLITHLPAGEQKEMWVYFGHETSGFVVSEQTGRGGSVCFPWLSVWRYFYSKADCTVSGCLYTISIIMEEDQPLPHAPHSVWRPLFASQSVTVFFIHYSDWLFFTRCFSVQTSSVCFWLLHSSAWFIHSSPWRWMCGWGELATSDMCVWTYICIYVCVVKFVAVDWRHAVCVCNPSWLQPVTRILQEEMAECGRHSLPSHMEFCFGL